MERCMHWCLCPRHTPSPQAVTPLKRVGTSALSIAVLQATSGLRGLLKVMECGGSVEQH